MGHAASQRLRQVLWQYPPKEASAQQPRQQAHAGSEDKDASSEVRCSPALAVLWLRSV